ncbi:hemerythrin family protein [Cyanobacterium stanieri LEGE 03274]|uniref:Hemerythrin family protein n=1 Tax=Cyanobacterium stanieri LEGE 03274 TaxID=1828756 RepID=A0ABR9V0U1_9CHRO|nr:bacteriohemerythrin [Cyanobacterium stanieri]MBE9221504.1 hemerythrin family protein [Cyanobacterium stanieri LEGE 03274]
MSIAFWRDEYLTGENAIDQQHKYLFKLINQLHNAMMEGHGQDVINNTLGRLVEYTIKHFDAEEQLMIDYNYPNYIIHKEKHDSLKNDVIVLQQELLEHQQFITAKVSRFLTDWLIHHIKGEDLKMIKYIQDKKLEMHQYDLL